MLKYNRIYKINNVKSMLKYNRIYKIINKILILIVYCKINVKI